MEGVEFYNGSNLSDFLTDISQFHSSYIFHLVQCIITVCNQIALIFITIVI